MRATFSAARRAQSVGSQPVARDALLRVAVGAEVGEHEPAIAVVEQALDERREQARLAGREAAARERVDHAPDPRRRRVERARVVGAARAQVGDLLRAQAEDVEVLVRRRASRISIVAPSSVPIVSAPFSASFMLPVPEASWPAVEICSERSAAGMIFSASDTR